MVEMVKISDDCVDLNVRDVDNQSQFILVNFDGKRFNIN